MRTTLLALSLVLSLGGCGSKSKAPGPVEPTPSEPAPDATPETPPAAGDGKLSEAECNQVLDHVLALMDADASLKPYADEMRTQRAESLAECVAEGTRAEYDCFMAATVAQALMKCGDD